ncbi:flagellar basal body rod protein FlgC [Dyella sp. A6]|uniref:flagellar basal body rod protein FlgC n=1 Tax=Dyella aluminiiresistens TaxID=3069105 RepID=UPI002E79D59E|nr:flagellar basal body rod protein FlgC [Dyella sp. A6]
MSLTNIFNIAGSGMAAQSLRLNVVASNLANANSVASSAQAAYHSREPVFSVVQQDASMAAQAGSATDAGDGSVGVKVDGITQSNAPIQRQYEPGNPMADANGYVYSSNVNPVDELVNMISASRSYQNNVEVMNTTKQLMLKTLSLGN